MDPVKLETQFQEIDSDGLKKYSLSVSGRDYLKDVTLVIHNPTLADMGPYPLQVGAATGKDAPET